MVDKSKLNLQTVNKSSEDIDLIHSLKNGHHVGRGKSLAWFVFALSSLVTIMIWQVNKGDIIQDARERFDFRAEEIESAIHQRMQAYQQVLRGGVGLFAASEMVTRDEWHTYVTNLKIEQNYPGIQGIGFSEQIASKEKESHITKTRAEGFSEYSIWPEGERPEYTSIIYLEPFSGRNLRAFGYDMFSDSVRRRAMEKARDSAAPTISPKVTLVLETDKDVQAGFLMYFPVYRKGQSLNSVEDRREALHGYVYSPFRMDDLMKGILGREISDLVLEIYDGTDIKEQSQLFSSKSELAKNPLFRSTKTIEIEGHTWTLNFLSLPAFEAAISRSEPRIVLGAGLFISLLLFGVSWSLANTRERALALANDKTKSLRASEEKFRVLAETANDAIVSADRSGNIIYFNRGAEIMFGYSASEIVGKPLTQLMPDRFRPSHLEGFKRFISTGEARVIGKTAELVARKKDESEFPVELSLAGWETGGEIFFTGILRDITERKRILEELKQAHNRLETRVQKRTAELLRANSELQKEVAERKRAEEAVQRAKEELEIRVRERTAELARSNAELEQFAYVASHDLQEPLRMVAAYMQLLERRYKDKLDDGANEFIEFAVDGAKRMQNLINDLLVYSRVDTQGKPFEPTDCQSVFDLAARNLKMAIEESSALVSHDPLPIVMADRSQLTQLLQNLIGNAIKFRNNKPPEIHVGVEQRDGQWLFSVRDNGIGIDTQYAERIFIIFQRLHNKAEYPGTGIGLALCKKIVERHGGRIWVESEPGKGSTFYFTISLEQAGINY